MSNENEPLSRDRREVVRVGGAAAFGAIAAWLTTGVSPVRAEALAQGAPVIDAGEAPALFHRLSNHFQLVIVSVVPMRATAKIEWRASVGFRRCSCQVRCSFCLAATVRDGSIGPVRRALATTAICA
jgi:hypothetical protein